MAPRTDVDLATWVREHADVVTGWLDVHGAVLFRGFGIDFDGFADVARGLVGDPVPYRERSSPRTELAPGVYTSTDYPADQTIPLHNENSYQLTFPSRLVFGCMVPALGGGETPLADCRRVLARLGRDVVAQFHHRRIRYVRNYSVGAGLTWQDAFQTTDPGHVEAYCRHAGIDAQWRSDGALRTEQTQPAIAVHPRTREAVWFNHAAFFHVSSLAPAIRDTLLAQFGEAGLPTNTYYGDGTAIDDETLAEIRSAYQAETRSEAWRRGDVMVVDNLLAAHGRAPFTGPRTILVSMGAPLHRQDLPQPLAVTE